MPERTTELLFFFESEIPQFLGLVLGNVQQAVIVDEERFAADGNVDAFKQVVLHHCKTYVHFGEIQQTELVQRGNLAQLDVFR